MHKFRTILSVVATAAMVLGTMGAASAASVTNETRADFIVQLDQSLGIQPVTPSTPDFTDVPASNADYGYIEAAYQKGFINGIAKGLFGPTMPITRAEAAKILVEAYEGGNYTPTETSTTFTDNASIPTALVGFVAEANSLKLMLGFTSGAFGPEAYLTTAQETHLIAQLKAVQAAAGFKVTASSTDVGIGQIVTLSSTAVGSVSYTVTGANASSALISGSSFVASAAGNYTVTGTDAAGNTATVTIGVYGDPAGLKISAPTSVVANGASQTNVTVSIVDANGNVVANDSTDSVTLATSNAFAADVANSSNAANSDFKATDTTTVVNGVGTFVLQSGVVPGATATLTATTNNSTIGTSYDTTASVSDTAQVATSLSVSPSTQYMSVNGSTETASVNVEVLDQSGQPMLFGTYPFSVSLSGPATINGTSDTTGSYAFSGASYTTSAGIPSVNTPANSDGLVTIAGEQGVTGAITVTASGTNLKSGTGMITAEISGSPAAIELAAPTSTSFAQNSASGSYTVSFADSHGYPVNLTSQESVLIAITDGSGNVVDGGSGTTPSGTFSVAAADSNGTPLTVSYSSSGATVTSPVGGFTFTVTDTATNSADAGTYTVAVSDAGSLGLTAATTSTLTQTTGSASALSVSSATYVSAANPTVTISAQVIDGDGNSVADAGVPVTFSFGTLPAGVSSSNVSLSATTVDTNSDGLATVTASVPTYAGKAYTVNATASSISNATYPTSFTVESAVATQVTASVMDTNSSSNYYQSQGIAQAGDTVSVTVYAKDQYNDPILTGDTIDLSYGGTGTLETTSGGTAPSSIPASDFNSTTGAYTLTLKAYTSGTVTITATDASVASQPTANATMAVTPGPVAGYGLFNASGSEVDGSSMSFTANTPVALTLEPIDAEGNPTVATGTTSSNVVNLSVTNPSTGFSGDFRIGSASGTSVTTYDFPQGSTAVTIYFVPASTGTGTLTVN